MSLEKLLTMDVSSYVEKKQGLSYLSWANAWREFIKVYPDATYVIQKNPEGGCEFGNERTGYMVYTTVTANGLTHEMWLPVMDFKNKSMPNPTTFDINKAVMRCLTKNLAMFGLGLYIYAGEDLPEPDQEEVKYQKELDEIIDAGKIKILNQLIEVTNTDVKELIKYLNSVMNTAIISLDELTLKQYNFILKKLKEKSEKLEKEKK